MTYLQLQAKIYSAVLIKIRASAHLLKAQSANVSTKHYVFTEAYLTVGRKVSPVRKWKFFYVTANFLYYAAVSAASEQVGTFIEY